MTSQSDSEAVPEIPTQIVVSQTEVGAEVVAVGIREVGDVGVEGEPIDDVFLARRTALGLQTVVHAEPHGGDSAIA